MEFERVEGAIIHIWNKYSTELLDLGICADLIRVKDNYELCVYYNNKIKNIKFKHMGILDKELKERLAKANEEYKTNPPKKKKGCSDCKKKKTEAVLEKVKDEWIPSSEDIKLAFAELTSFGGVKDDKKEFINRVYVYIFNEEFDWNCRHCVNNQARRFKIYMDAK